MDKKELSGESQKPKSQKEFTPEKTGQKFLIGEEWDDYEVLLSDNLFTVLSLDPDGYDSYDDDTIAAHFHETEKFLDRVQQLSHSGIDYSSYYPNLNVEMARRKIETARQKLHSHTLRKKYHEELVKNIKSGSLDQLNRLIKAILADKKVTAEESIQFINDAKGYHFTEEEAADMLYEAINKAGLKPLSPVNPEFPVKVVLYRTDFGILESGKISREEERYSKPERSKEVEEKSTQLTQEQIKQENLKQQAENERKRAERIERFKQFQEIQNLERNRKIKTAAIIIGLFLLFVLLSNLIGSINK
ncbi:MAG: hypothetical protein HBSAPP04_00270 [Ignavibacteriaceae bacterium]|nr:MAG: hypothetical protein HBSAPP04_00270 [Ignavibacteriaceae bacterium]